MNWKMKTLAAGILIALASWPLLSLQQSVRANSHRATEIWKEECGSCHGPDGKGRTRAGRQARVKDFTDAAYQDSFTDEEAIQVIKTAKKDGKELRNKNPYADKLTEQEIRALVEYVRQFAPR